MWPPILVLKPSDWHTPLSLPPPLVSQAVRSDSTSTSGSTANHRTSSSSTGTSGGDGDDTYYQSAELQALHEAMEELRNIVGEEPTDDALRDILIAADMDINRAVNFYFS